MKKRFALLLACILICTMFFACGKSYDGIAVEKAESQTGMAEDNSMVMDSVITDSVEVTPAETAPEQKLIRKIWLETETDNMDPLLTGINQRITELGGYVESRNVYNGSQYSGRRYRNAELTVRIPADKLDEFVQHVENNTNITSNRETAEDITLTYVAIESRMTALQTEEQRLLELLAEAKDMDDLLQIEDRLTQVRTELEQVKSQLQVYDNQVSYGTVYLTVKEVTEYTVVEEPETVWERIGSGFTNSLKKLGNFFVELFVFIIVALPYLVILALPGVVVWVLVAIRKKKNRTKKDEE